MWLFPFPNKTLSDEFNDTKMDVEVKLASALNRHKGNSVALRKIFSGLIKLGFCS